jgi:hypothetical protein
MTRKVSESLVATLASVALCSPAGAQATKTGLIRHDAGAGGLPKASALYATSSSTTDDAAKFPIRLADSLIDTFLSALALEFQSADFIDFLKTQLEPLILPSAQEQAGDSNTDGS